MSNTRQGVSSDFLQLLRSRADISNIISSYVQLSRKGRNLWACCPFHHEKTASFCVYEDEQTFHCYGCGVTGDVYTFIMKIENLNFIDAVELLANKTGLEMPKFTVDNDVANRKKKKDLFLSILKDANNHYKSNLQYSQKALDYLKKRELTKKEVECFEIGYSKDWSSLINFLLSKGYSPEDLIEIGIAKKNDSGKLYDTFAYRLMFPIFNKFGDCVGFSGRDLEGNSQAKYKNSSQSIVFDKGSTIYALNLIKKLMLTQKINYVILCEGQIDVISMHKAGFNTAIASLGTAFTENHAREISRITDNVILCLDGDSAGVNATLKAIQILRNFNLNIKVATIVGGKDPDEIINKYGREKMEEIINASVDSIEFEIKHLASMYNLQDMADRTKFLSGSFNILNYFSTYSEKEVYIPMISKLSGISQTVIREDLYKHTTKSVSSRENTQNIQEIDFKTNAITKAQYFILSSLLHSKDYAKLEDDFDLCLKDTSIIKLYEFIKEKIKNNQTINVATVFDLFDEEEINGPINDIINFDLSAFGENASKHFQVCVNLINKTKLEIEKDILTEKLKTEIDNVKKNEIVSEIQKIMVMINKIKSK